MPPRGRWTLPRSNRSRASNAATTLPRRFSRSANREMTSRSAFTPAGRGTMMMGDTVVLEDEVNPAMSAALDAGLEVTALHNHFFFDEPKVFFMHIGGHGDVKALAAGVKKVYDKIAEIRAANPSPRKSFPGTIASSNSITAAPLEAALG